MKQIRKLRKQGKSAYIISIPIKTIKKFDWDNDTYLQITESKNGIFLTTASAATDIKSTSKSDWINDNGPVI